MRNITMQFGQIRAVLFDLDGTLIDSASDLGAAADKMRTDRGMPPLALNQYRRMAGAGARGMIGVAFGVTPDHTDFSALKEEFLANYERCMTERTDVFDGVPELVAQLRRLGLVWGVVTNKAARLTVPLVGSMPLFASASVLVCGDTTAHTKPHPAPLFEAARRIGIDSADCLYVGDDQRDIVAGLAARMGTVAANYGYLGITPDSAEWGAHASIEYPLELLQLISQAQDQARAT